MFRGAGAVGALTLGLMAAAASAQDVDLVLANATGYPIRELYLSASTAQDRGADRLGRSVLENGQSWTLAFPQPPSQCLQDLRIVFDDDGSEVLWEPLDLCGIARVTLTYNRRTGATTARTE